MISATVAQDAASIKDRFQSATPFKHVVIDDFLDRDTCEALLRDFPAFDAARATDEHGRIGRKAVFEHVLDISPSYGEFYRYINTAAFLTSLSELTGIPDLIADATLFGGGTHDNQNGQALYTHVDFNIDPRRMLHRRVNLLLYLNKAWQEEWGGLIELHSDPRHPSVDVVKSYLPLFNRVLIFETNEYSWHGFKQITLPPDHPNVSRKSFSIYLYSKERPIEEIKAPHTTFYLPEPLPGHMKAGHVLTENDERDLQTLTASRDGLLEMYQKMLIEKEQRFHDLVRSSQLSASEFNPLLSSRSGKFMMAVLRRWHQARKTARF